MRPDEEKRNCRKWETTWGKLLHTVLAVMLVLGAMVFVTLLFFGVAVKGPSGLRMRMSKKLECEALRVRGSSSPTASSRQCQLRQTPLSPRRGCIV